MNIGGSSCAGNGQLLVRNGGIFNIGEASNNVAIVHVINGGKLTIGQNGVLKIENGSQVVVENGGKLIIEAGAKLNLVGTESKIVIKNGGELIINGQPPMHSV